MSSQQQHEQPPRAAEPEPEPEPGHEQQPQRSFTWSQLFDTGSQGLDLATAATSAGFSTAKFFTSAGIEIAKRATQYSLALPAYAFDLASADTDGSAARGVHAIVGSVFDGVSMLALGAVDISGNITAAALGAASTGLTSLSSALSSELARSLTSFARLVQRNWNHVDDASMPPGGIPQYSIIQITRALTAWVSIQLVTRPMHEQRILAGLDELDIDHMQKEVKRLKEEDQQQHQRDAPQKPDDTNSKPRITSESRIGPDGGDVITAEIGQQHSHEAPGGAAEATPLTVTKETTQTPDGQPLTPAQTLLAFDRYSRLVLGIYGGVAMRYLGVDIPPPRQPQDPTTQGAGVVPPPEQQEEPQEDHDTELKHDEADFLAAAATLDLSQTYAEAEASGLMPGGWEAEADGSDRFKFVLDPEEIYPEQVFGSTAVERNHASPGHTTPPSRDNSGTSAPRPPGPQQRASFNVLDHDQRPPMTYSLIDLLSGKHDDDVFHQLAGVERGTAEAGVYSSTSYRSTGRPVPSRPKFYVVTDHSAKKVVLVLRGTLTFGDVAADLTCDSVPFENMDASRPVPEMDELPDAPPSKGQWHDDDKAYVVHEGMYHTAVSIGGSRETPVHRAVSRALAQNPAYDLDITGHSLGAGLAAILALLWVGLPHHEGDGGRVPLVGRTSARSGLPVGRKLHAYCFGVPSVMSAPLGRRCVNFISSWTHSFDVVSRFSLGHVLDIRNAIAWLAYEERVSQPAPARSASASASARAAAREERRKAKGQKRDQRRLKREERRTASRRGTAAAGAGGMDPTEVDVAASALADDAAAALADRGEPVSDAAASFSSSPSPFVPVETDDEMTESSVAGDDDDEDDEEEEEDVDEDEQPEPTTQRREGPPFDMTNLIKQAFAHIASAPKEGVPPSPSSSSQSQSQPDRAQTAYDYTASFLSRATQPRFSSPADERAARAKTEDVFWALRSTLEANMRHVELYPPGDVLVTFDEGDLLGPGPGQKKRLFLLKDGEGSRGCGRRQAVFGQIEFRTGFLARHLPQVYHGTLKAVLDT
ncbi:unnamed protein product [Tilletia controversa]|uniref:sn-1-specific diacylglycerol lipase n=1 Tax=Tilletia controversa TaxID=13291 RepID=A0A8X7MQT9_9BASI|nr:hypothetical protein CF328_g4434 [Tilletia controversa]KAE8246016.1 hypothetical protein A4X06_0g5250 [Tilletia controversa]CAD6901831.1 unnamed protein product [Tilletia controversa]CAD6911508.1 unnamed protein product [Tilletia controversa]CAD6975706.1 unnamed protein product [Tilletia controversa]